VSARSLVRLFREIGSSVVEFILRPRSAPAICFARRTDLCRDRL
jgi:hypothetical protein